MIAVRKRAWKRDLSRVAVGTAVVSSLCFAPQLAGAQDTPANATAEELDAKLKSVNESLQELNDVSLATLPTLGLTPGLTTTVPTAYGLAPGSAGVGFGYQERTRYSNNDDGAIGAVIGLGRAGSKTGLNVGVTILDLSDFGDRGSFNLKLHHRISDQSSVAVGLDHILNWGGTDTDASLYGVYTHRLQTGADQSKPFSEWYLSAGVGNGRFRTENDVIADKNTANIFGSVTTNLHPQANIFAEWSGQDLNVGLSIVPFKKVPLIITPALVDITGSAGDGTRFTLAAAYAFSFR